MTESVTFGGKSLKYDISPIVCGLCRNNMIAFHVPASSWKDLIIDGKPVRNASGRIKRVIDIEGPHDNRFCPTCLSGEMDVACPVDVEYNKEA